MFGNQLIMSILRSPLHPILSGSMLVLTLTGRKSARPISLPVSYYRDGDVLWVSSMRSRKWWRNLQDGALVMVRLAGKDLQGYGEVILNEGAVMERFIAMIAVIPQYRKAFGIRLNDDNTLNLDDLRKVASERMFVKITLKT